MKKKKTKFTRIGRFLLWIPVSVFILIIAAYFFINVPAGRRLVRNQVENYLESKFKSKVDIGSIDYSLPKWLKLKNVYIEDQRKDTLMYGEELSVDLDMMKLLAGNTDIHKVFFKNMVINVNRPAKDSLFNYQFILDAFTGNKSTTAIKDTAEMKLTLERLIFDNVGLNFKDDFLGNNFTAIIKDLDVTSNRFQPDRVRFGIDDFYAKGVKFYMTTVKNAADSVKEFSANDTIKKTPYELFITAKRLKLRDVDVIVDNKVTDLYYSNKIGQLYGTNMFYSIGDARGTADSLLLDSSAIVFSSAKKVIKKLPASSPPLPWLFAAKELNIKNTQIKYDDINKAPADGLDFSHFDAKNLNARIAGFHYSKDSTTATVSQFAFSDKSGFVLDTTHMNFLLTDTILSASELYFKTPRSLIQNFFELRFDTIADLTNRPQNSLIAATLNGTTIAFNDLYMLVPSMAKPFPKGQFVNQYVTLNTELRGTLQRMYLPYLQIKGLSGSSISARGTLYNISDPERMSYDLYIINSSLLKKDIFRFVPPANQKMFASLPALINLRGSIKGTKNDLVGNVNLSGKDLAFAGKVNFTNIADPARMNYGFAFTSATLSRDFIAGFLPPKLLQQISLPPRFTATGKFSGTKESIVTDMRLSTSYGPLYIKGFMKNLQDPLRINYDLYIKSTGFALGKLLKQDSIIGNFSGVMIAKGTGFDYKTMRSDIKTDIASIRLFDYNYQNAKINANFSNGFVRSIGDINDPNLKLTYNMNANLRSEYPIVYADVRVDTAQLYPLHFTDDTFNLSMNARVDAKNLRPRNLDASLFADNIKFEVANRFYELDTTSLIASSLNGIDSIVFNSAFADVHAGGAFDYDKIGPSLLQYVNNFYKLPGYKPTTLNIPDQQFAIKGVIRESPIVSGFVPGLNSYDDITFSGRYVSADTDSALNFKAVIPKLSYTTNSVSNGAININAKNGSLNYDLKFDTLTTPGRILYGTVAKGAAAKDSLSINVFTRDNKNKKWFELAGTGFVKGDAYTFRLQDTLMLNYERWRVQPGNYVQYSPQGIIINRFQINSDTAVISLNSKQLIPDSPIDIAIDNFNLKSVSSFINKDTILVAGLVDMKATVSDLKKELPSFIGTASVTDLQYMQQPIGNVTASAQKQSDNNISAEVNLTGFGNDVHAKGNYYLNNVNQQFDADMQVNKLNFKTFEAFSGGQLKNSSGNISGNVNLTGKFADPRWQGQLNFDTVQFTLAQVGTPYKIDKQKIVLDYPAINFPKFTITDSLNNELTVNGKIVSKTLTSYDLDVNIKAKDFILINAKKAVNSQVYGFAAVGVDVAVTGSTAAPALEGDISVNDKSDLTIVLPQTGYAKNDGKLIVRFIDRDTFDINPPVKLFEPEQKTVSAFAQFVNYNLNIGLTKAAALTILIDPATGDQIKVQGDAQLNAGVDPGGNLVLAGVYELDKGYYDLHYGFLQRKFNLIKGSTITFAGTPVNAEANITAEYIAYTSSKDLLTNEVTDVTPVLANSFRQKLPFRVILYLTGPLYKPDIKFDIQLPEQSNLLSNDLQTTIENKLQQIRTDPALINKQVFSLLLLNRFVSEQSSDFFRGNGGDFNDLARQSVSQFLSSALNEIASDLFKGIDIDLNLNSYNDFSNGGQTARTDLNVAVSKTFANDRVVVSVGKNFGVEGQDAAAKVSGTNSGFKPDITLTYKLTPDGRYLIRAYTKNQFEVTLDGYVVETGLAFQVAMDYDKFRELFRKRIKTKKQIK